MYEYTWNKKQWLGRNISNVSKQGGKSFSSHICFANRSHQRELQQRWRPTPEMFNGASRSELSRHLLRSDTRGAGQELSVSNFVLTRKLCSSACNHIKRQQHAYKNLLLLLVVSSDPSNQCGGRIRLKEAPWKNSLKVFLNINKKFF